MKMDDKEMQDILDEYSDVDWDYEPIIETGREPLPLYRFPADLDFVKTIGGTTYTVRSRFDQNADECLFGKINRLLFGDPERYDDD